MPQRYKIKMMLKKRQFSTKFEANKFELLCKYGSDLTELAEKGELNPVIGRGREIELAMQILCKRRKNSLCFLGSPGIGLTSIVEGLAQRIAADSAPLRFLGKKVIAIQKRNIFSGCEASLSEIEQRMTALIEELKQTDGMVILFMNEVDLLLRIGDKIDQCVGAFTKKEYQTYIESNTTLRERFQPVDVPEPTVEETLQCLKLLHVKYAAHHNVKYSKKALVAVAQLSRRSHSDGFVIDKAIDMMDEAGARVSLQLTKAASDKKVKVTKEHITSLDKSAKKQVGKSFMHRVSTLEKPNSLLEMEACLRKHIIGQEKAIETLSSALLRAKAGIRDTKRPIASFIFTGPTGVGKTGLANAVAIEYFGSLKHIIKLDMSEYKEQHSVSKLFGSPPGYVSHGAGGQLTKAVMNQPESVVVFDEVEKAHPDIFNTLLQVLEDGTLTDGKGTKFSFTKTLIIFTSNIGHNLFNQSNYDSECGGEQNYQELKEQVMEELKKFFRLELLNRLDDIVVFQQIRNRDDLMKVLEIMLDKLYERLKRKDITVEIKDNVKNKLIEEGYDPIYGVRPLRRCITRLIEDALAQWIVDGDVKTGDSLVIDLDSHGNVIKL
ncbi:chaperone protein ClpC, chloroplastic-like [Chenopodium quinoa]|uniref:Uncharacterized protein n=1 Tax=Chenopodium quinoa TaxID=63459 RepID=A0A803LGV4_CHEQI|nr:chaperone protein ClpC, chloroplastic-like [Chenopodium quinoa]